MASRLALQCWRALRAGARWTPAGREPAASTKPEQGASNASARGGHGDRGQKVTSPSRAAGTPRDRAEVGQEHQPGPKIGPQIESYEV